MCIRDRVRRHDERVYLATRRLRLFPFVHFDEQTSLRTQLEDLRNDKEPDANHHLYHGLSLIHISEPACAWASGMTIWAA